MNKKIDAVCSISSLTLSSMRRNLYPMFTGAPNSKTYEINLYEEADVNLLIEQRNALLACSAELEKSASHYRIVGMEAAKAAIVESDAPASVVALLRDLIEEERKR